MKQRLLTAAIGLVVLLAVLFLFNTWVLHIAVALFSAIAVYEVMKSAGYQQNKLLVVFCLIFTIFVPFFRTPGFNLVSRIAILAFLIGLFVILLYQHKKVRFEAIGVAFAASILIPFSLSTMIYMRDQFPKDGLFFAMLVFAGAWFADAGGYFIGRFFGKHKLAPNVSPKKTVEGAVGGVAFNLIFFLLLGFGYALYRNHIGDPVQIHYVRIGLLGMLLALVGMLGDLSASVIKRQCGVKDFGNLFPGHGGVMDRFDSVLFVAPCLYVLLQIMTPIS